MISSYYASMLLYWRTTYHLYIIHNIIYRSTVLLIFVDSQMCIVHCVLSSKSHCALQQKYINDINVSYTSTLEYKLRCHYSNRDKIFLAQFHQLIDLKQAEMIRRLHSRPLKSIVAMSAPHRSSWLADRPCS